MPGRRSPRFKHYLTLGVAVFKLEDGGGVGWDGWRGRQGKKNPTFDSSLLLLLFKANSHGPAPQKLFYQKVEIVIPASAKRAQGWTKCPLRTLSAGALTPAWRSETLVPLPLSQGRCLELGSPILPIPLVRQDCSI